ncbi:MAG: arginine--tRNA ligase [Gemmatimonadetes bacterium]|nr:arginine--tRNA ligase [Gemmatimonadota bacterium]MYB67237.1 arginine--tRNA ligase [Gemmatimonadota bacterium]
MITESLETRISAALARAGAPADSPALVGPATRPEFGDYQANGVMAAAKKLKTNPRALAAQVVEELDLEDMAASVDIAGPGFINIQLKGEWLAAQLGNVLADPRLGLPKDAPQKVVLDYSHPNLAKEMHIGHLRSTVIGDAIARVLEFSAHEVVRHNHVGDWGTQFGMLIAHLDTSTGSVSTELADLEVFYQSARQRFDQDAAFADLSREYVVKLQSGDPHVQQMWQQFIDESLAHGQRIYDALGVDLKPEDVQGESAYNDDLPRVVEDLRDKGLLVESNGAQCVFLEEFKNKDGQITPVIVQKSDGGYLYATSDLAAVRYRAGALAADRILYIVDARQSFHLQQVFAVARAAGYAPATTALEHHEFGAILGADNRPFKTRAGGVVKLMDVLEEGVARAFAQVSEKNPDMDEAERRQIARVIGIGSIKYMELSFNRTSDYVFDWDKMLALDGNTAPYMLYSYARIKSMFRRAGVAEDALDGAIIIGERAENALAIKLLQFPEVVVAVAHQCYPHMLCNYLYELADAFMKFYEQCPVLRADEPVRTSRLLLALLTARIVRQGLDLLGIETLERM